MPNIYIPEFFRPILEHLGLVSEEEFEAVRKIIAGLKPHIKPEALVSQIEAAENNKARDLVDIVKALSSLSIARLNADASVEDFVRDIVRSTLQRKDNQVDRTIFETRLRSLLAIEPLILSARAFNIQHEYEHVFKSARIITDIRTVFDPSGAQAIGAVIVHNLKISYIHNAEAKDMLFALDDADIGELKKVLERAEIKTGTLEKVIEKTGVPYFESKEH